MPLIKVSTKDLPLYCPNPHMLAMTHMPSWSAHPRIFIDVMHGEAHCAYCGTRYKLGDDETLMPNPHA